MTRQRRTFTPEFILQLLKLYENGKSRADIAREYDITPSALDSWVVKCTFLTFLTISYQFELFFTHCVATYTLHIVKRSWL